MVKKDLSLSQVFSLNNSNELTVAEFEELLGGFEKEDFVSYFVEGIKSIKDIDLDNEDDLGDLDDEGDF